MSAWLIAVLSLLSVPFMVALMGLSMCAVFDLLDLTQPRQHRIHALRSIKEALTIRKDGA